MSRHEKDDLLRKLLYLVLELEKCTWGISVVEHVEGDHVGVNDGW